MLGWLENCSSPPYRTNLLILLPLRWHTFARVSTSMHRFLPYLCEDARSDLIDARRCVLAWVRSSDLIEVSRRWPHRRWNSGEGPAECWRSWRTRCAQAPQTATPRLPG